MRRCTRARTSSALGIAPLTSMFQYGENDRRMANDWRPEIHDSDGLAMWSRQRRVDVAPAGQPAAHPLQRVRRREPARLRPAAARPRLRPLPGRRRVLRAPPEPVGGAEVRLGQGLGATGGDCPPTTRPTTTSSPSGRRTPSRAPAKSACSATACTGARGRRCSRRPRAWRPRAPASAASWARSASTCRGASRSTSKAATSRWWATSRRWCR